MESFYEIAYGNVDMTNESEVRDKILYWFNDRFMIARCSNSYAYLRQKETIDAFKQFLTRVVCDPDLSSVLEDENVIQHVTTVVPEYIATFEQINADHVRRLRAMQSPWEYLPIEEMISVDSSTLSCVRMHRHNSCAPHETNLFCSFNGLHGYVASLNEFATSMYVDEECIVQPVVDMLAALTQVNRQSFEAAEARRASSYEIKMIRVQTARDDGLVLVGNLQMHAYTAGVYI
jgi:hypothetical protein